MALEALLPSEIARLIYGYLIEEKCLETAKVFLNESPNLQECRNVLSHGKHFTTRVCGYALMDILEKFCIINSIVQEKVNKFDNTDKLKYCNDLIKRIQFLVEEYRGQHFMVKTTDTTSQNQSSVRNELTPKSCRKLFSSNKDEDKLIGKMYNEELRPQIQTNLNPIEHSAVVDTTLLKDLPGYIKDLQIEKYETLKLKSSKKSKETSKIENKLQNEELDGKIILQKIKNENRYVYNHRYNNVNKNISTTEENLKMYSNCGVQTSERWCSALEKNAVTYSTKNNFKNVKNAEVQTISSNLTLAPNDECIEILTDLSLELINRTEIQERIADNINRILDPIKSTLFDKSNEEAKEASSKPFIAEMNKAFQVARNKTENDPEFLKLLNEIIPDNEEIKSVEDELEVDNENVNNFKEKIKVFSKENISQNNIPKATEGEKIDQSISNIMDVQNTNKTTNIDQVDLLKSEKLSNNSTVLKQVDSTKRNSQITGAQNMLMNNTLMLLNPLESPILGQKNAHRSNFFSFNNSTSTPIKTCASVQNLDTYDWFSTQDLLKTNIVYHKEDIAMPLKTNTYTACETRLTTMSSCLSPIISKETSEVSERITAISYVSTSAVKDQTLQTPEMYSPKIKISTNIPPTFPVNIISKYTSPFTQKSSEVIDELLNLHTSQKSNGNVDTLSPLLKDNNEYNRYFSIESIMLYGMDNNISTVKTPLTIPEIEVEDSITLTGTGLSPFLKIHKKSDVTDNKTEKNNVQIEKSLINEKPHEFEALVEKNDNKIIQISTNNNPGHSETIIEKEFFKHASQIIMKQTPTKLLENQSKNNRLSLSTPKKPSNYIRALNFNTPINKSYSESKIQDKQHCLSTRTIKENLKNSCKSSLFQSPPFTNSDIIEQKQSSDLLREDVLDARNLDLVNDNSCMIKEIYKSNIKCSDKISKETSCLIRNNDDKSIVKNKKNIQNKSWDSELRNSLGQSKTKRKNEPEKQSLKKKIKEEIGKKIIPKKRNRNEKLEKLEKVNEPKKSSTFQKLDQKEKSKNSNEKKPKVDKAMELSSKLEINTSKDLLEILSDSINNDRIDKEEDVLKLASDEMNNLTKINNKIKNDNDKRLQNKTMTAICEIVENELPEKSNLVNDLKVKEVDNKIKDNSPENKDFMIYDKIEEQLSIITNANVKNNCSKKIEVIYDRVNKVERGKIVEKKYARLKTLDTNITKSSFISDRKCLSLNDFSLDLETPQKDENTLQVPPTPQVLSPGSSSLMMPISKLSEDSRTIQSLVTTPLECPLTPKIILTPPKTDSNFLVNLQTTKNSSNFQSTLNIVEVSKESEITQFKVIKENLLKHKKIDDNAPKQNEQIYREKEISLKSYSPTSSSCSCKSCTPYSSSDDESSITGASPTNIPNNDSKDKKIIENTVETSPAKLFLINKPEELIEEWTKETPAKNESICAESEIFETPSISKMTENPINLNTKISHIMMLKEEETKKVQHSKVKIINVDPILSEINIQPPIELLKSLPPNIETEDLEVKDKATAPVMIQRTKIEKSEEETVKAVESIMIDKPERIDNKENNPLVESIVLEPSFQSNDKSDVNKIELVKAIESIIKSDHEMQQSAILDVANSSDESDSEANLEVVLEDENLAAESLNIESDELKQRLVHNSNGKTHRHNTRFKSRQMMADEKNVSLNETNGLSNCNACCHEVHYVFKQDAYKRKRRKAFSESELMSEFRDEFGNMMVTTMATNLDMIFKINPARKKPLKKTKPGKKDQIESTEDITQDSISNHSNNNIPISNAKAVKNVEKEGNTINNKRKKAIGEIESNVNNRKRKKNMFIL